jgi:hypothetical protein
MISAPLATFLARPLVKYGVPVLVFGGLCLALWIQGLRLHSAKLERDAAQAQVKVLKRAIAARDAADQQKDKRDADFKASQDAVGRPDSPALYLCRLRAIQRGDDPAACR